MCTLRRHCCQGSRVSSATIAIRRSVAIMTAVLVALTCVEVATPAASSRVRDAARERCIDTVRDAASVVTLHLADRVGLARETREEMMRETMHPWRAVGVNAHWSINSNITRVTVGTEQPGTRQHGRAHIFVARVYRGGH
jgi:hypothetical protein